LTARIPSGLLVSTTRDDVELEIKRSGEFVMGALALSDRMVTPQFNELAFRDIGATLARVLDEQPLVILSGGGSRTSLGGSIERTWRVAGTSIEMRAILVPICAGTGSLVFLQGYQDPYGRAVLDGWMNSFQWIGDRNIPACNRLDPK
jgi:hypothetical protein